MGRNGQIDGRRARFSPRMSPRRTSHTRRRRVSARASSGNRELSPFAELSQYRRMSSRWLPWLAFAALLSLASPARAQHYRIGVFLPLSGAAADKGIPFKNAIQIQADKINTAGGVKGHKIELVFADDANDPERARQAASSLVQKDVLAVIGTYYAATALGATQVLGDARTVCLFPTIGSSEVIGANPYMFSLDFPDEVQGGFIAVYLKEVLKKDNVLVIHSRDPFGLGLKQAFLDKASRIGLKVVDVLPVDAEVPASFVAQRRPDAAANAGIGAVVALTHSEAGLQFLPQLRQQGINAPVIAPNTWTNKKFITDIDEKITHDVYVTAPFLYEIANEQAGWFAQTYKRKYGDTPPASAALAYDSLLLLANALGALTDPAKGVTPTRQGIRDWLAGVTWLNAVEGATGNLFFKNLTAITDEYVGRYYDTLTPPLPHPARAPHGEVRAVERDVFVSVIKDGRYKVAFTQLALPREEYVLKELPERVKKGYVIVVDGAPYHVVNVIFAGVDVVKINDVNTRDMNWDVDVFVWFKWDGERVDVKEVEKIGIVNLVKEQSSLLLKENLAGPIKYRVYRKRLTLNASYDLSRFPFDSQSLPLTIAHNSRNSTHLMLVPDARHMDDAPVEHINPQEWIFVKKEAYADLYRYTSTFGDPDYRMGKGYKSRIYFSTVNVDVTVKRILQPYLFTFFLPLVILLAIIMLILWVPLDQFTPRINASISGLVGVLVYHMSQKNSFPKVGYAVIADYYFLLAYAFIVTLMINIISVQNLWSGGHKEVAKKRNRVFSISAIFLVIAVYGALTALAMLT
jgi:branched-chain amino acid transport system substrate-binding protein